MDTAPGPARRPRPGRPGDGGPGDGRPGDGGPAAPAGTAAPGGTATRAPAAAGAPPAAGVAAVVDWFGAHGRPLPWRSPARTPWQVLVSEVMLQQTPVARVLPVWAEWVERWPRPADLAASPAGDAVRAWGRLGYPRRALRLHAAAAACVERHGGEVPAGYAELRALPGVGDYTAAAVVAFAFSGRAVVLDTNVRRVLARWCGGLDGPAAAAPSAVERVLAEALLPADAPAAARWSAAAMELGAVVCTARSPACPRCPVRGSCAWLAAGRPPGPARRAQPFAGTDRQARGRLLAVLRAAPGDVDAADLAAAWDEPVQRRRALDGLVADGLVRRTGPARYGLPA